MSKASMQDITDEFLADALKDVPRDYMHLFNQFYTREELIEREKLAFFALFKKKALKKKEWKRLKKEVNALVAKVLELADHKPVEAVNSRGVKLCAYVQNAASSAESVIS